MTGVYIAGGVNLDLVAWLHALPQAGETVIAKSLDRFPGGKGSNQAVACARLGAKTRILGAIGDDEAGRILRASLADAGVDMASLLTLDAPTGQALISVSASGENSIIVASGANSLVRPEHVREDHLAGYNVILSGFEAPLPVVEALLKTQAAGAMLKILNAAPALAEGDPLLALADIIVVNEGELGRYAGLAVAPEAMSEIIDAARQLTRRPGQTVVVTLGGAGAIAVTAERVVHTPGRAAVVVDTTGAGDCFCGALAARLSAGFDMEAALNFANTAAAIAVTRRGAGSGMPTLVEVETAMTLNRV